jgi:hypothetical protein
MTTIQTYQGIIREGQIQVASPANLPEGSHVYVIVAGKEPVIEEKLAQRKATRWLVEYVGNMLTADEGRLVETNGNIVWRFGAFITGPGHKPLGPIGYVDIEAHSGVIFATEEHADQMITHGEAFVRSLLQTA